MTLDIGPSLKAEWRRLMDPTQATPFMDRAERTRRVLNHATADGVPLRAGMTVYRRQFNLEESIEELEPEALTLDPDLHEIDCTESGQVVGLCVRGVGPCGGWLGELREWYSCLPAIQSVRRGELLSHRAGIDRKLAALETVTCDAR